MSESVGFVLLARTIKIRHETMHVRHRAQTLVPVPVRDGRDASGRAGARESGPVERPDERRHATRPDVPTPPDAQPCPHTTRPRPSSPARVASTSLAPHTTYTTVVSHSTLAHPLDTEFLPCDVLSVCRSALWLVVADRPDCFLSYKRANLSVRARTCNKVHQRTT